MPLSWTEIKHRAIAFSKKWQDETREAAERQPFWEDFFGVFGLQRRHFAIYEDRVKNLSGNWGSIDLLWPGTLLVEHKSAGEDLDKAHGQGMEYIRALVDNGRRQDVPRYLIVCDFQRIAIHDLEPEPDPEAPQLQRLPASFEFPLADFHKHIRHFFFMAGYKQHKLNPEDPANEEATRLMCDLHDALEAGDYGTDAPGRAGHELKQFLVRLLFCLFAEDNGLFDPRAFQFYLEDHTAADGSDLGPKLHELFEVLNTPEDRRQKHLDPDLAQFPYINGLLFQERLALPAFTSAMRTKLLACCGFEWDTISPAVFGSLFQAVMDAKERRKIGAHYTAERNILKVVRSLFLDDLRAEFDRAKKLKIGKRERLSALQKKVAALRFLDPACGCGNFLVITYRELRALELEILLELHAGQQQMGEAEVFNLSLINVDQMFGIEIEEFPARIAEVALWLTDHQANMALSVAFTQLYRRIPLRSSPHIHVANALRKDWKEVLPPAQCSYVLGNPPFVGKHYQTRKQKEDLGIVLSNYRNLGDVDYVVAWFKQAAEYIHNTRIKVGFVATNSITQGEQVPIVWGYLLDQYRLTIHFAHRSFPWESEARGKAHVHVVIIGFAAHEDGEKRIFDCAPDGTETCTEVPCINPYLLPGALALVRKQQKPLCPVPAMRCGNKPSDGGNLILNEAEKNALLKECPDAENFLRRYVGSEELINGIDRWCLWLADADLAGWRALPAIKRRVDAVKVFRLASNAAPTKKAAEHPHTFFYKSQPACSYIAIPEVSSENRTYIPIAFLPAKVIASNKLYIIESSDLFLFGVLSSAMHMAWIKVVSGRLESRFQYSGSMVYNTFPWPAVAGEDQKNRVRAAAEEVLKQRVENGDGRLGFLPEPNSRGWRCTLADLYDPLAMPVALVDAHAALNRAVDRCYRKEKFPNDRARIEYLFALYEQLTAPLALTAKPKRSGKAVRPKPLPQGKGTPQSEADAAHHYSVHEEAPPYRVK